MKVYNQIALTLMLLASLSTPVFSAAGSPVVHSHGERTHSHPLPAEGKNHIHGKKAAAVKVKSNLGWSFVADNVNKSTGKSIKVFSKNGTGTRIGDKATGIFKFEFIQYTGASMTIELASYAVSLSDCKSGFGTQYSKEVNATSFKKSGTWAEGSGTIGSSMSELLCTIFK